MKLEQDEIKGIKFWHRTGFSDLKTFEEVIGRGTYLKRGMQILPGERWMDCGGNVGAFALLACSLGAEVVVYEPDPYNCEMIGNNNNVWRNSIVKKWNSMGIEVQCANFDSEAKNFQGCKMDIEGAEMPILEETKSVFGKFVYEWSFDIDPSLTRLWKVLDRQKEDYRIEAAWNSIHYHDKSYERWQPEWFPACTNVFCYEKNPDENN
mgnify:CR=1 FL=1